MTWLPAMRFKRGRILQELAHVRQANPLASWELKIVSKFNTRPEGRGEGKKYLCFLDNFLCYAPNVLVGCD